MTTDTYINQNKTATLKKGDKVEMFNCHEATFNENKKIWTCQTDSFLSTAKEEVVFLEGYSGYFAAEYLKSVDLYQLRQELRSQIRTFWKLQIIWTDNENKVYEKLTQVHAEIIRIEMLDENKVKERVFFSVAGYSSRHGYFRNKRLITSSLDAAIADLEDAKKDNNWRIHTLIVKETYYRLKAPAMVDFDSIDVPNCFSDKQELVRKHSCGNKEYRWYEIMHPKNDRFTY